MSLLNYAILIIVIHSSTKVIASVSLIFECLTNV